jgi:hypothetical protein
MRCSLATTAVDRRDDYFAKKEHRQRPDFNRQVLRGAELQEQMRLRWANRREPTNPDAYLEGDSL